MSEDYCCDSFKFHFEKNHIHYSVYKNKITYYFEFVDYQKVCEDKYGYDEEEVTEKISIDLEYCPFCGKKL